MVKLELTGRSPFPAGRRPLPYMVTPCPQHGFTGLLTDETEAPALAPAFPGSCCPNSLP